MAARARRAPSVREVVILGDAGAALPQRFGRAEESVDRGHLLGGRRSPGGPDIHYVRAAVASLSMRMALALNSAVPDLGSVASMVRTLVATWSGKCRVMKASPGLHDASKRTGTSTDPRRELTSTRSPSAIPSRAPSDGEMRRASRVRRGDV